MASVYGQQPNQGYYGQRPVTNLCPLCDPGLCGPGQNCGIIVTGALLSILGIISLGLGIALATFYVSVAGYPFIPLWPGVIYIFTGLLGSALCCCIGHRDRMTCVLVTFMAMCIISLICALAQVFYESIAASYLGLLDAIIGGDYDTLDTVRGLHIASAVVGGIVALISLVASVLVCATVCCGPMQPIEQPNPNMMNYPGQQVIGGQQFMTSPVVYQQSGMPAMMYGQEGIFM